MHVLLIEGDVFCPLLFFKVCLVFLEFLHKGFVVLAFLFDFFSEDVDLVAALVHLIVWHIDSSENIRLFSSGKVFGESGLHFLDSGF